MNVVFWPHLSSFWHCGNKGVTVDRKKTSPADAIQYNRQSMAIIMIEVQSPHEDFVTQSKPKNYFFNHFPQFLGLHLNHELRKASCAISDGTAGHSGTHPHFRSN